MAFDYFNRGKMDVIENFNGVIYRVISETDSGLLLVAKE